MRCLVRSFGVLCLGLILLSGAAQAASDWPKSPVTVVNCWSPGGGMDQELLPLKPFLEKELGQNFLYAYKPGAGGRIGWETIFANGAKGYTIGANSMPHLVNTMLFGKPSYKVSDFAPIAFWSADVPIWFVRKDSPYKDMNDLIAAAKKRPGEVTLAIGSFTGEHYITVALIEEQAGVKFRAVNVKGGSKVRSNILGGHFEVGVSRPGSIIGIKDEIRGLGLADAKRNPLYPDVKTFDEQLPSNIKVPHMASTSGILAHRLFKENDPEGFARLVEAVKNAVHSDGYQAILNRRGTPLNYMGPDEAEAYTKEMTKLMEQFKPVMESAKKR
jgi:tripartite-type tricarboxylate transporter receptor subunit TctC